MLQANPQLRWRDVQDILIRTAVQVDQASSTWVHNGAGLHHSDWYGFGKVDAYAAVQMARAWTPEQATPHALLAKEQSVGQTVTESGITSMIHVAAAESEFIQSVEH